MALPDGHELDLDHAMFSTDTIVQLALHHIQFQIGSMMFAPGTQRQMGSRVFNASTTVQPGQHYTTGSIQTALPCIQTGKSNANKQKRD